MNAKETARLSAKEVNAKISKAIRAMRLQANISQGDLGKALGVTFQQVQKYENGTNRASAGTLAVIAHVLGVPVSDFYGIASGGKKFETMTDMLSMPYGPEVVQSYSKLTNQHREVVWQVAAALAGEV